MAITSESVSALSALGCFAFGVYSFVRSRSDNREEKTTELENRANHTESFLEFKFPDNFKRWRK